MDRLRIGVLGAARITPGALVAPAKDVPDVEVTAVAARDRARAEEFASKHGIPRVARSYQELVDDPEVDAIYNPLPNGLHGHWTIAALAAGKHVLCEKPFTANEAEALQVKAVADASDRVVMEAFHYRYHPLAARMAEIVASGELGTIRRLEAAFCAPLFKPGDIRWKLDLAGGSTMDLGCYAIHQLRLLGGGEPEVIAARAKLATPGVDRWMQATMRFPSGATGTMTCAMASASVLRISAKATGDDGALHVVNPVAPQRGHRLRVTRRDGARRTERLPRVASYRYQLEAFRNAVLHGGPVITGPDDSVATMRIIDAVYRAAGLEPRQPAAVS